MMFLALGCTFGSIHVKLDLVQTHLDKELPQFNYISENKGKYYSTTSFFSKILAPHIACLHAS